MSNGDKHVVLSVDDEPNVLKALNRSLRKLDVEFLTAPSGAEAMKMLKARPVDVIITDMRMPGMTGDEFLAAAKAEQPMAKRIVLTGHADIEATVAALNTGGVSYYLSKPWNDTELRKVVGDALKVLDLERENQQLNAQLVEHYEALKVANEDLEDRVARRTAALERTNDMLEHSVEELEKSHAMMIDLLANLSSLPNPESENTDRKIRLALAIGEAMGFDEEELLVLKHAMRLHRIGCVGVPRSVIEVPRDEMSSAQRDRYERHPLFADTVLQGVPNLRRAAELIRQQHEAFDGSGFPDRMASDGINLGARIVSVSRDYYDFLNGRIETAEYTPAKALKTIRDRAGRQYDPEVVKIFERVLPQLGELDPTIEEVSIEARMLQPGMRLSRDLLSEENALLLPKGFTLSEASINTLINLEQRSDQNLGIYLLKESLP